MGRKPKKDYIERDEIICQEYLSGVSLIELGAKYNISKQRIHQIICKKGVHRIRLIMSRRTLERKEKAMKLRSEGLSNVGIAIELGVSGPLISRYKINNIHKPNDIELNNGMRICNICNVLKPLSFFYKNPRNIGGIMKRCKKCQNEANAKNKKRL